MSIYKMRESSKQALALFREKLLGPTKYHHAKATTSWTWHVNNDDDCYVKMMEMRKADKFLLIATNGIKSKAIIASDPEQIVEWVAQQLREISEPHS